MCFVCGLDKMKCHDKGRTLGGTRDGFHQDFKIINLV